MRTDSSLVPVTLLACFASSILAYPGHGWAQKLEQIRARAAVPIDSPEDSYEMIGDLISPGPVTNVGQTVADIIVGKADGQSEVGGYVPPGALGTTACKQDTCCVWNSVAADMTTVFKGPSGRCTALARGAIRLGFHDAAAWSKTNGTNGGADGSMILTNEVSRTENRGLEEIVDQMRTWYDKYKVYDVGAADLVQFGANVATVVCPLGPRVRTFVGRYDSNELPPEGLLPDANGDADGILALFEDKTIRPHGLAALLGAHTTSQQRFFNTSRALDPQDSTPGVWDTLFYNQTVNPNAPARVLKFPSDVKLSAHPRVNSEWMAFTDPNVGQAHWDDSYAKEYVRLSLLGVYNINNLTECTQVLPAAQLTFISSDSSDVNQWANGGFAPSGEVLGQLLSSGQEISNGTLAQAGVSPQEGADKSQSATVSSSISQAPSASIAIPIPWVSGVAVSAGRIGTLKVGLSIGLNKGVATTAGPSATAIPLNITTNATSALSVLSANTQVSVSAPSQTVTYTTKYVTVYSTQSIKAPVPTSSSKAALVPPQAPKPPLNATSSRAAPNQGQTAAAVPSIPPFSQPLGSVPGVSLKPATSIVPVLTTTTLVVSATPVLASPKTIVVTVPASIISISVSNTIVPKPIISAITSIIPKPSVLASVPPVPLVAPKPSVLPSVVPPSVIPKPSVLPSVVPVPYIAPKPPVVTSAPPSSQVAPKPTIVASVGPLPVPSVKPVSSSTAASPTPMPAVIASPAPVVSMSPPVGTSSPGWSFPGIPGGWSFPAGPIAGSPAQAFSSAIANGAIPSNLPQGFGQGTGPGGLVGW